VIECPSTQEREAATLYLTDLNMRKNIDSQTDLLRFNAKVQTSHSKTRSAYTLMDPGVSTVTSTGSTQKILVCQYDLLDACRLPQQASNTRQPIDTKFG